jgi:hypothetical protein
VTMSLVRNLMYLVARQDNRPSITTPIATPSALQLNAYLKRAPKRANMVLTESMAGRETLGEWIKSHPNCITNDSNNPFSDDMWRIVVQAASACYAMSSQGLVHHDLHDGNMFIDVPAPNTRLVQRVGDVTVVYDNLRVMPRVYDFDNAWSKELGANAGLDADRCVHYAFCNQAYDNFDVLKLFSMLFYRAQGRKGVVTLARLAVRDPARKQVVPKRAPAVRRRSRPV